jgi:TolB-like protein/Tfp pilus assembly protein PilF
VAIESGFRIGDRQVHPSEGRIAGPTGALRIEPKAMAVLLDLARHAGQVRSREDIIGNVWPRGFVSDDVLTRCIGQLRKALEDDPRAPVHVETIPKRGYRLRGEVEALGGAADCAASGRVDSLIVLPFQNLAPGTDDYIADGLTELLIARLAARTDLRVISRTTAMRFKGSRADVTEVVARTGADWVIEGSVLQSVDRIQVVAQLIAARTDAHVWAADYVRNLGDLLSLQNEIAARVADAIRLRLGVAPAASPPVSSLTPAGMRSYLKGRQLLSQRTLPALRAARSQFSTLVDALPEFASGWASMAESELLLAHYEAEGAELLVEACERHLDLALNLDADLAIALSTRGALRFFFRRELEAAAADLERALALLPSYAMAMLSLANVCAVKGESDEAGAWMDQALLVDPLDVGINMNVGDHLILRRDYEAAATALRRALVLSPEHRACRFRLAWALGLAGQHDEAQSLLAAPGVEAAGDLQWHEYAAMLAGLRGDREGALRHYRLMSAGPGASRASTWSLARAAAAAGRYDEAVAALEQAARQRSSSVPFLRVTPAFDALHGDARFRALADSLRLPVMPVRGAARSS